MKSGPTCARKAAEDLAKLLQDAGCEVISLGSVNHPDLAAAAGRKTAEHHLHAVAFASASWFEDYLVLDLLEEFPVPVLLWSLPGMETGALCGTQQLTAYLKQLGVPFSCIYGPLENGKNSARAISFLQAAALKFKLRRARVGLAGHRVIGMTEVAANEMGLKKSIGPRIVNIDLPGLLNRAAEIPADSARPLWQKMLKAGGTCKVPDEAGLGLDS